MKAERKENLIRSWYKFSAGGVSVLGLVIVVLIIFLAVFAPVVAPYPEDAGAVVKFADSSQAPNAAHIMGTDTMGRDVFSRLLFSLRGSLLMGILVLAIAVPVGFIVGVLAGYYKDTWVETVLMRIVDIFLSVPALVLALAIAAIMEPNLKNSMIAITISGGPGMPGCRLAWFPRCGQRTILCTQNLQARNWVILLLKNFFPIHSIRS